MTSYNAAEASVSFDARLTVELIDAVADLDEDGSVIGIEILSLLAKYPGLMLAGDGWENVSLSTDVEADACYIRFGSARSAHQTTALLALVVSPSGCIIAFRFRADIST